MQFPKRILVVRTGAIGDVVNALVFANAVKDARPQTRIGWVVHPLAQPLVERHPSVDRVHLWRRGGGLREARRVLAEVRGERYEVACDLQRIQKSALLARLSGAPRVLGYDRARSKELSWIWTGEHIAPGPAHEHMVEQYLAFARLLGLADARARHSLPVDARAEARAEQLVTELGAAPVLVNLGASKPANRWPAARFAELVRSIRAELDAPVYLTGSGADRDTQQRVLEQVGSLSGVQSLVGDTTLLELLALTRRARACVSCDTGPMHMAVAVGTPTVALFGPADPRRTGPHGALDGEGRELAGAHRVVRVAPACAPCQRSLCHQPRHACMEDITADAVLEALASLLARS